MNHEQERPAENKMSTMPIKTLLITMALPMMISMLVQALYNIVDSIFVSRLSEDALTAVSMAFPMQNLMIGLGSGIGVGTNALLSRALGEKKPEKASQIAMHGIFLSLCGYLLLVILGLTIVRPYFVLQDASPVIEEYGVQYMSIVMCASFGMFAQFIFERLLQSTGKTIYTMFTQGTGAIINIILDPIMIFGLFGMPKFGIAGAAIATVIGQIVAAIMALIFNLTVNKEITLRLKNLRPSLKVIGNILYIGIPSIIMVGIGSIMTFSVNKILAAFTSTAVAVFGAYFKLQSFFFMPVFGLNNGMIPIAAYNYGAKKPERVLETMKYGIIYGVSIMLLALLTLQIIPAQLLSLFNASEKMLEIGVPALRIISISFLFAGVCIIASAFFQALGNGIYSTIVSFTRQLVFLVPLAYLFSRTGNIQMVWWAWPIAEVASITLSIIFLIIMNKKVIQPLKS